MAERAEASSREASEIPLKRIYKMHAAGMCRPKYDHWDLAARHLLVIFLSLEMAAEEDRRLH